MRHPIERAEFNRLIHTLDLRCVPLDQECIIGTRPALSREVKYTLTPPPL